MQDARIESEVRSRNPNRIPKPFYDSANKSIEHWEVVELEMSLPEPEPVSTQNGLISSVRGFFQTARYRISRFLEVYDQENE